MAYLRQLDHLAWDAALSRLYWPGMALSNGKKHLRNCAIVLGAIWQHCMHSSLSLASFLPKKFQVVLEWNNVKTRFDNARYQLSR